MPEFQELMYEEKFKVRKTNSKPQPGLQVLNDSTEVATLTQPTLNNSHSMCLEAYGQVNGPHLGKASEYSSLRERLHWLYLHQESNEKMLPFV